MAIYGNFEPTPTVFTETISDVNDCLATLTNLLVTSPSSGDKWTESPTGTFTSPVDGAGRFVKLVFDCPSTSILRLLVLDQNGSGMVNTAGSSRSIVISGATVFKYYTCSKFVYIHTESTFYHLGGGMLTAFPESEGVNGNYVYAHGQMNNAGNADYSPTVLTFWMLDNGAPNTPRTRVVNHTVDMGGTQQAYQMGSGAFLYEPVDMCATYSGSNRIAGRMYNAYLCDASLSPGVLRTLPIGNSGETGTFIVLPVAATGQAKLMLRTA